VYLSESQRMVAIRMLAEGVESRDIIVKWLQNCVLPNTRMACDEAVKCLWRAGLKIEAIKLHRSKVPGRGLKDAKDDCEAIDQ
jgi:hypothetical protein